MNMQWLRCPECTHKILRYEENGKLIAEVKCPSCGNVFTVDIKFGVGAVAQPLPQKIRQKGGATYGEID